MADDFSMLSPTPIGQQKPLQAPQPQLTKLQQFRQQFPMYNDMSDFDLAKSLHQKYYSDIPRAKFNEQIGLKPMSMAEVGLGALKSAPGSALEFGKTTAQAFMDPVGTVKNVYHLGRGVMQYMGITEGKDDTAMAEAFGNMLVDRYGSIENVKHTLSTDPVGFLADASMLFSGGETALGRLPGVLGKAGKLSGVAGRALDPLAPVGKLAAAGAKKIAAPLIGEFGTQTGAESIIRAGEAGYRGGEAGRQFRGQFTGVAPMEQPVFDARGAVANMKRERGAEYTRAMRDLEINQRYIPLPFTKITQMQRDIFKIGSYKGVPLSRDAARVRMEINAAVQKWARGNPDEMHTATGMDALKQHIYQNIRSTTQYGTQARVIADRAAQAVKKTIIREFPEYKPIMQAYEKASNIIKELERSLVGRPATAGKTGTSIDTSLRKLQSTLRNNVSSNFKYRRKLAEYILNNGAPHLMYALAGQALNKSAPRGLGKLIGISLLEFIAQGHGAPPGAMALMGSFMSPRIAGNVAYGAGKIAGSGIPQGLAKKGYQGGRVSLTVGPSSPYQGPQE